MKKQLSALLAAALCAGALAGCGANSNSANAATSGAEDTVTLAVVSPVTGDSAEYGIHFNVGAQMAADKINEAGGINGKQVVLKSFDSKNDAKEAAEVARLICQDKTILATIGDFSSTCCMATAPIYEENKTVQISPSAGLIDFPRVGPYNFSTTGVQENDGGFLMNRVINEKMGAKSVAIVSMLFTFKNTLVVVVFSNLIGFWLAYGLAKKVPFRNFMRAAFYLPRLIGGVILGFVWQFIFLNIFPFLGEKLGWGIFNLNWLGTPSTAFWGLAIVQIWGMAGYMMIIYVAGLTTIPSDYLEAAIIDGATARQQLTKIVLPLLMPSITECLFLSLLNSFKVYDVNLALTGGGPYRSSEAITMNVYTTAFSENQLGYMLMAYDNINCFVTQSDEQASGIINAIKAKGENIDDYVVVSIDCSSTGQTYLKSGELDATVLMAMKQLAVSSADYVQEAMDGETVDKKNSVAGYYQLVTPDTYKAVMEENGMTPDE